MTKNVIDPFTQSLSDQIYWEKELLNEIETIVCNSILSESLSQNYSRKSLVINTELSCFLNSMSGENEIALFTILLSVLGILKNGNSTKGKVIIWIPIMGKSKAERYFTDTLPIIVELNEEHSFVQILEDVKNKIIQANKFADFHIDTIINSKILGKLKGKLNVITIAASFDSLHNYEYIKEKGASILYRFDISNNKINLNIEFLESYYTERKIDTLFEKYVLLLKHLKNNPHVKLKEVAKEVFQDITTIKKLENSRNTLPEIYGNRKLLKGGLQLKRINGYFFDKKEVEEIVGSYPRVKEVFVTIKKNDNIDQLIAYYTSNGTISSYDLELHISDKLCKEITPAYFIDVNNKSDIVGEIPLLNLPLDYARPAIQSDLGATVSFTLSEDETANVRLLAKDNDLTLYMSVLSVFTILLSKLSGQEDIVVGTPLAGRNHSDLKYIMEVFVNTLAIKNKIKAESSIKAYLEQLRLTTLRTYENQECQFEDLEDKVFVPIDISHNYMFNVMFNMFNQTEYSGDLSNFDNSNYKHIVGKSKFDLTLTAVDYGEQLMLSFEYCTKLFRAETIERYIGYFKKTVNQITSKLDCKISEIDILSIKERQQLLYEFNNTKADYPKDKTIHQLFKEQVERTPNNTALKYKDKILTYRELDLRSNQLAHYLVRNGILNGCFVGVMMDRSIEMIIGVFGILKAGCAYVPLDMLIPQKRLEMILSDLKIKCLLTQKSKLHQLFKIERNIHQLMNVLLFDVHKEVPLEFSYREELKDSQGYISKKSMNRFNIEGFYSMDNNEPEIELKTNASSEDIAYVIYTSGSTGVPKGVYVKHQPVINVIEWVNKTFEITKNDRLLFVTSLCFDLSVYDIFGILSSGASLSIISQQDLQRPTRIINNIYKEGISFWDSAPAFMQQLVPFLGQQLNNKINSFRLAFFSGDYTPLELPNILKNVFSKIKIISLGGATEATIWSNYYPISEINPEWNSIPYGKPIQNSKYYILNGNMQPCPIGNCGELYIGGECLASGYINDEELTKSKFILNPFVTNELIYKTGDLARWLSDGNIEFLGRIDHQVKIRGFRIELGEIESVLQKHNQIKDSVVIDIEESGDKYLCAYLVIDNEFDQEKIRTYLSTSLPDYMIPSYFVELDKLPLTSNGKVNRKVLPSPEVKVGKDYVAPSNEVEEKLVEIWSEVLKIAKEEISVTANFFALGGHSLNATLCINKIKTNLNISVPLIEIFKESSISQLANVIDINKSKIISDDDNLILLKQGEKNGGNIFLIHTGTGNVDGYIEFCNQANDNFSYWGISVGEFKKNEPQDITVEKLAEKYIRCIKKVQPYNGYIIVGRCYGGTIALEMVRQMEQKNERIIFLGIIHATPPIKNLKIKMDKFTVEGELNWISNYLNKEVVSKFKSKGDIKILWNEITKYLNDTENAREILRGLLTSGGEFNYSSEMLEDVSLQELIKYLNFTRSIRVARYNYVPINKINTQIHYFVPSIRITNDFNFFSEFSMLDMKIREIEGDSSSIFKQPNVNFLFKQFKESLNEVNKEVLSESE
ncbi:MAG: amino acid adenylation domain-containing protein [Bacteroidales bacterium]|nr:amino acid adenylation domain-containing protein [Bacteroidales bacterium]